MNQTIAHHQNRGQSPTRLHLKPSPPLRHGTTERFDIESHTLMDKLPNHVPEVTREIQIDEYPALIVSPVLNFFEQPEHVASQEQLETHR